MNEYRYQYLFLDFMVEDSHKAYCNAIISSLNERHSSIAVMKKEYLDYSSEDNHIIFYINSKETVHLYPIRARINTVYNYLKEICIAKKYQFDKVFVLGYDPIMFTFMYRSLLSMGKLYLVEHHQLDEISRSKIKRKLWERYAYKVDHVILDNSIYNIVNNTFNICKNKLHVFPHPCICSQKQSRSTNGDKVKVLCISMSNDVDQVNKLIEEEQIHANLQKNNIVIVIRKNELLSDNHDLLCFEQIDGFLSGDEYNALYSECDYVLMPFPTNYKYRCSGTLIDALASGKRVISSALPESEWYSERFPNLCAVYKSVSEIPDIIKKMSNEEVGEQYEEFLVYQNDMRSKGLVDIESS